MGDIELFERLQDEQATQPPPATAPRPRRRRRRRRALAIAAALLVLVAVGLVAGYSAFLDRTVAANVKRAKLLPDTPTPAAVGQAQNVLLIGSDPTDPGSRGRSDMMILAHVPADRGAVHLVHFPRDMYVAIPGRPGRDKLNAAYAHGGAPLLVSTLQTMLDVPIDHVAQIDMAGFVAMTDAIGGVDVEVEEASPGFAVGTTHLDGARALAFVRERTNLADGDLARGRRGQQFVKALMLRALSTDTVANPVRFASFVDAATSHLTVDDALSHDYLRQQALGLAGIRGRDVHFITAPIKAFATTSAGAAIDVVDEERLSRLSEALRLDELASYR